MKNELDTVNAARFAECLAAAFAATFATDPRYATVASRTTPSAMAHRMVEGLAAGIAGKPGPEVVAACRKFGIGCTRKAIATYLKAA